MRVRDGASSARGVAAGRGGPPGYVLAGVAVGLALLADKVLPVRPVLWPFALAAALAAWRGGPGPGLAAAALAALTVGYFFVPPEYELSLGWGDLDRLLAFAAVALLASGLRLARTAADTGTDPRGG